MLDYVGALFTDFVELHGDRAFADDPAIVGGTGPLRRAPVMVLGHQKGRDDQGEDDRATSGCRTRRGTARRCA